MNIVIGLGLGVVLVLLVCMSVAPLFYDLLRAADEEGRPPKA